jgi:hypothetical protein
MPWCDLAEAGEIEATIAAEHNDSATSRGETLRSDRQNATN